MSELCGTATCRSRTSSVSFHSTLQSADVENSTSAECRILSANRPANGWWHAWPNDGKRHSPQKTVSGSISLNDEIDPCEDSPCDEEQDWLSLWPQTASKKKVKQCTGWETDHIHSPMSSLFETCPERMLQCPCGIWLQPDEHTENQIKLRFDELVNPYFTVLVNKSLRR